MKPIRVLTPQLQIQAEIDNYESLIFTRRWHKPGEFEIRVNRHKKDVNKLTKGNLIMLGGDPSKVGIIKHREIELGEQGKITENWLIKGWTISGITKQRVTVPPEEQAYDSITDAAETVMKHYVDKCLINPADLARKINILQNATDQGRGQTISWQSRYKNLAEELEKLSVISGLGWNIYLDFELLKWIFEVYEGKDLTVGQSTNPPVIFSPDFDALRSQHYAESELNYKNLAYVAGQGEGAARTIVTVPQLVEQTQVSDIDDTQADFQEGTLTDVVATSAGDLELVNNPALSFDGVDDYVNCGHIQDLGDTFTIEVRVEQISLGATYNPILFRNGNTNGNLGLRFDNTGNIEFRQYTGDEIKTSESYSAGEEIFISVVSNNLNGEIFVDGVSKATGTFSSSFNDTGDIELARYTLSSGYYGNIKLKEVRIWNVARTQQQIQNNINVELTGTETGLVAYYKINEGSGTTLTDSAGSNDGTINGATWVNDYKSSGTRTSPTLDLSPVGTAKSSIIEFTTTTPAGTSVDIETNLSLDGGQTWKGWKTCTSGQPIPDITEGLDLSNAVLQCRQTLITSDTTVTPGLSYLALDIQGEKIPEGTPSGLSLVETFVDARDLATETDLQARGEQKLAEFKVEKLLEAQILPYGPFKYEEDWDLGDIVTIQNKDWGVTMDARIIEVKEIYEPSGFRLEAVFGNSWPTLLDKIKSEFEQMSAEIRK